MLVIAMKISHQFYRHHEIRRFRSKLERDSFPRLQMLLLVTLTGASGFAASYLFLHAGLIEMWLRYLASFAVGYLVFLVLLWLWLRTRAEDYADLSVDSGPSSSGSGVSGTCYSGKGGNFGGGGASGSFDTPSENLLAIDESEGMVGDAIGAVAETEEFAIPLFILALVGAMVFSSFVMLYFMVYSAPALFAELMVDGVLSASLYHRLRGLETRHWLETAFRHTALPFVLTAAIISASGWAMSVYAPEAHSIGDVVFHFKQSS